jgi:hypothetical protein
MSTTSFDLVYETCVLLVKHYRNLLRDQRENNIVRPLGCNSRLFEHMLHPEKFFVYAGKSKKVTSDTPTHPEHVVPCAFLMEECLRLIKEEKCTDEEIAKLLQKHWKLVDITKEEQRKLDLSENNGGVGLKSTMPPGWTLENGDTFARLTEAGIDWVPASSVEA